MDFRILGPLEVHDERGPVPLGGTKPRAVLAMLLLHPNTPVSAERMAAALWGEDAPARAVKTVQVHVSRVRKALGEGDVITTSPAGYCLRVGPGELDAERFAQLVAEGRGTAAAGDPEHAAAVLRSALQLWRGPPLADLATEAFAQAEIARLEEQRLTAIEARIAADLALGREEELIGELQRLASAHPTRERLAGQLMLALYRCGRQADALEAYREARNRLVAEIGVEPGPDLRELQDAILQHDESLRADRVAELPRELARAAAALPLEGRDVELAWLREHWQHVLGGARALVTVRGEEGMGKSRLAAEFASEAHARGATVLYADAAGSPGSARAVLARARKLTGPTVLVVDDVDRAPAALREELRAFGRDASDAPVLVLALDGEGNGGGSDALELSPLDGNAVHAIVSRYVPERGGEEPPEEWLFGASRGVPARVHELADEWARREAARRVRAGAARTAARRAELRAGELELAADVAVLDVARARDTPDTGMGALVCPFKGLASFQVADAPYFFGRERLVAELVARLVGAPLLAIVGPSGSGKSSVLRAGLLPALAAGVLPGSERCRQVLIRPGAHPLAELQASLDRAAGERIVLAVDQFEETLTICDDLGERAAFVAELARLADRGRGESFVVLAIRADFYGRYAEYPELSRLLAANHVLVGAMNADELRRAVECPARQAGLIVDPELVDALIEDVQGEPGALPLLSTALLELWQQRDGRRLRYLTYVRAGGVRKAVARLGEDAFARLDPSQQAVARRILLRLAAIDDEGGVERRRVAAGELGGDEVAPVVDLLADNRLVTVHAGTVEVAHEALLREWPRLRGWIQEDKESLRIYRSLSSEAREWVRHDRDDGALLRGARLAEAREWIDPDVLGLADFEREFLAASIARRERDRKARRRSLEVAFGALALGLVCIAVVAAIALHQRREAQHQRDVASSRALAAQAHNNIEVDPALALRLALAAFDSEQTPEAAAALREATAAFRERAVVRADTLDAWAAQLSTDGKRLVTGGTDGNVLLWDVATHKQVDRWAAGHGAVFSSRYARHDKRIALGFEDGTVVITDAALGSRHVVAHISKTPARSVAFTGNGERVAAGFDDGSVRVFTVDRSEPPQVLSGHEGVVNAVDASADGTRVVSAGDDGTVRLWRLADGTSHVLYRQQGPMWDTALSPDGKWILAGGLDGFVHRWNAATGHEDARLPGGGSPLKTVAFSRDGGRFAAGGVDGDVFVWAAAGGPPVATLRGQGPWVYDISFGPTDDVVASAYDDGTVRLWDAGRTRQWNVPQNVGSVDFDRSGRRILTTSVAGELSVWDAESGRLVNRLPGSGGSIFAQFSPVADEVLIADDSSADVRVWPIDKAAAQLVFRAPGAKGVYAASFDSKGERIVYLDTNDKLAVRDLDTGDEITLRGGPKEINDAQFSADGARVAVSSESGVSAIWRIDRPARPERVLKGHRDRENSLDYGRDGRLVTGGNDKTVRVWPAHDGRPFVMSGHTRGVTDAAFWVDPSKVLSVSFDHTLRLWDSRTGTSLGVLETSPRPLWGMAVSPNGTIATIDAKNALRVFKCDVCGSLQDVEKVARAVSARAHHR